MRSKRLLIIITGFSPKYAEMASIMSAGKGMTAVIVLIKPIDLEKLRATLS